MVGVLEQAALIPSEMAPVTSAIVAGSHPRGIHTAYDSIQSHSPSSYSYSHPLLTHSRGRESHGSERPRRARAASNEAARRSPSRLIGGGTGGGGAFQGHGGQQTVNGLNQSSLLVRGGVQGFGDLAPVMQASGCGDSPAAPTHEDKHKRASELGDHAFLRRSVFCVSVLRLCFDFVDVENDLNIRTFLLVAICFVNGVPLKRTQPCTNPALLRKCRHEEFARIMEWNLRFLSPCVSPSKARR